LSIVIIPIVMLVVLVTVKKFPIIRGNIALALLCSGLTALLIGGIFNPLVWGKAWLNGLDRLAWVIALSLIGSFYGATQGAVGALDMVVDLFRALFGKSSRGLVVAVIIAIAVGGMVLGDSIAAASVDRVLVIPALAGMDMSGEKIAATIIFGAMLGSIMPPISQAVYLSCSLLNIGTDGAIKITFLTAGIAMVICTAFAAFFFVNKGAAIPEELRPKGTALEIIKKGYQGLMPLFLIIILLLLNSGFNINIIKILLGPVYTYLSGIQVIRGLTNSVVMILLVSSLSTFLFKEVRSNAKCILISSFKNVTSSVSIQVCAAFFVGSIYFGGQIQAVTAFAQMLNSHVIKLAGGFAVILMAMLTGSQTSAQNIIFSFLGPMLVEIGVDPVNAAIAGSHLAAAGQAMPPSNLTAFVVAAMIAGQIGKKVDPLKTMFYCIPMAICLGIIGFLFLYI